MAQGNKILFWFRENLLLDRSDGLCHAVNESSEIIPVFCFDPREHRFVPDSHIITGFIGQRIHYASQLRNELKMRGSNLLVVGEPYEKIIPSLARVLKVSKVVTKRLCEPENSEYPELTTFRNQKAREVSQLLKMHSIPVVFEEQGCRNIVLPTAFPRFPEINPGLIPPS